MCIRRASLAIAFVALTSAGSAAQACMGKAPAALEDIKRADVVVIGRIANYTIVLDQEMRARMKALADDPDTPPEQRAFFARDRGFLGDYAKFDVLVDEVLMGSAPKTLLVVWDNSTFSEPESMPSGPFLMALRDPRPALSSGLVTIRVSPEPNTLTLLQAPCADAFIFETTSEEARAALSILRP
jgi:hypothetical protein